MYRASIAILALLIGVRPAARRRSRRAIPSDATESAACVPALGDIYWNPKKLPFGPTYGVYQGRLIFEEFMISQADFAAG